MGHSIQIRPLLGRSRHVDEAWEDWRPLVGILYDNEPVAYLTIPEAREIIDRLEAAIEKSIDAFIEASK